MTRLPFRSSQRALFCGLISLSCGAATVGGGSAHAFDIVGHIDFGLTDQTTTATGWNNVSGCADCTPIVNAPLVSTTGGTTIIMLRTQWSNSDNSDNGVSGAAANYNGPYPAVLADIPSSALRDSLFLRDGQSMSVSFENLPAGGTYDFLMYGAAANTGDRSLFTAHGASTQTAFITPIVNNSTQVATITGATRDATNKIRLQFEGRRPDGSVQMNSVNDDAVGRLNFMRITAHLPDLPGDYNDNGTVDTADYAVWRDTLGSTTDLRANGNNTGTSANLIDTADYDVWKANVARSYFGNGSAGSGDGGVVTPSAVPEPGALQLAAVGLSLALAMAVGARSRRKQSLCTIALRK